MGTAPTAALLPQAEPVLHPAREAAVGRLARAALAGGELSEVMERAVATVAELLGVRFGAVLEFIPESEELVPRAVVGLDPGEPIASVSAGSRSLTGYALRSGEPVIVEDMSAEPGFELSEAMSRAGVVSGAAVVIGGEQRPYGVLSAHATERRRFETDDIGFLRAVASVLSDAIERKAAEDRVRLQVLHDPLTGLPSRTLFLDRLTHALARKQRSKTMVGVLHVDVDRFETINASFGHGTGDALLVALGPRLEGELRAGDTLARLGEDDFAVLCEELEDEREATWIARRILSGLAPPLRAGSTEHAISVSIGIALSNGSRRYDADDLMQNADAALHRAKDRGGARHQLFDGGMRPRALERTEVERELRLALASGDLEVLYQPIVRLDTHRPVGMEALTRWKHRKGGIVGPADFAPLAEESGLIVPMGKWVLEEACRQLARWSRAGARRRVGVNLSRRQFAEPDLVELVSTAVRAAGVPPRSLALEVTEGVLVSDTESSLEKLGALRALGVILVLDDCRTGEPSLRHIQRFPLDAVKVDRSLVAEAGDEPGAAATVREITSMADSLGISAIAEGVETAQQALRLRELGCHLAQGYHFAPALTAEETGRWLARRSGDIAPAAARSLQAGGPAAP